MTKINFTGNIDEVKRQIEQTIATYELLGNRSSVDFEEWFKRWENGFADATENRSLGNYPLTGEKAWRSDASKQPRWRQWSNKNGIIEGEYWRDRSDDTNSIPLSGTAEQLINHVIQIEYEGGGNLLTKDKSKQWPPMKGQPQIKLYFKGENKSEAETSFRIMDKTDDPKIPLPIITKSDLQKYAQRIKEEFATPNLLIWRQGRKVFSYKNRWQGFDGQWWLCRSELDGKALVIKLLAIQELLLDSSQTRISEATDENLAFPAEPPDVIVLGEPVPQPQKRPIEDVIFYRAEIKLAKKRSPIPLVERGLILV